MEYQLYPRRWLFLLNVSLLNTMCTMIMVSFSPVATLVTQYYQISGDQVDLLPLVAMGLNVVGMVAAIYCIGKFKLLVALRYSTGITLVGGIVRGLSTVFSTETIGRTTQFWVTFGGQIIISLGVPIVIPMSTKTSQVWFGENERPISTAILSLSPVMGGILGQALSPLIMRDDEENVTILNLVIVSPLLLTFLSSWFLLKSAEPPTPPSRSAEQLLLQKSPTLTQICANMLKIIKNPTVFTIILCQGLGSGMTQTLLTQLNQLMCSRNYSINQSTWTAIINILVGFLGAFSINYFAKKHKLQEETAKIGFALACISTIIMMMALNTYENLWVIMLGFAGFGFFGYAAYPMSLELAVEESYPTDASISEAFMHIGKQFQFSMSQKFNSKYLSF